jgi:hypothetical protein
MLLRTIVLAAAVSGTAIGQCGTNQLTTPPVFVSNNSGSPGGTVYFQLNVLAANGVRICGISLNTTAGAGVHMAGTVYRHNTLTDPFALTSANVTLPNWTALCEVSGTSSALNTPSVLNVISGTNTLDLPPGLHLLAIDACPNWGHAYTNGAAALQTISDGNLTYFGGRATNVEFSGTPFGTAALARVTNAKFDYSVPPAPVTITPGGWVGTCASATTVGAGCGGVGCAIYEQFAGTPDLIVPGQSSQDLLFTDVNGTVSVVALPGSPIVPPASPNLGLGDDQNTALIPLGFECSVGGICAHGLSMASNGYVWLGGTGAADFTPSATTLTTQGARICPYWFDFAPNLGGTTHVDILPGLARCTWLGCFPFGGAAPEATVQVEITASTLLIRYDPLGGAYTGAASAIVVGFSNGTPQGAPPPASDLDGGAVVPVFGAVNLQLFADALLVPGSTAIFRTNGIPSGGVGAALAEVGVAIGPLALASPPFAPGCNQRVSNAAVVLSLYFGSCEGSSSIVVPPGPIFVGLPLVLQSVALAASWETSNAINALVGF